MKALRIVVAVVVLAFFSIASFSQAISDDFTQAIDANSWLVQSNSGYPCLTAGTSANNTSSTSFIPGCNYSVSDAIGSGALRFTVASAAGSTLNSRC